MDLLLGMVKEINDTAKDTRDRVITAQADIKSLQSQVDQLQVESNKAVGMNISITGILLRLKSLESKVNKKFAASNAEMPFPCLDKRYTQLAAVIIIVTACIMILTMIDMKTGTHLTGQVMKLFGLQ